MHKKLHSGMLLTLLLIGMLTWAMHIQPVSASGTIYIRPDGSIDPLTAPIIRDGDLYTFTDDIHDSIVVERDNIVVDGTGFTVEGAGSGRGIELFQVSNVTVRNTRIEDFSEGIHPCFSSDNTLWKNNITNTSVGIYLTHSDNNTISGNNLRNNNIDGIFLAFSSDNSISENTIAENDLVGVDLGYSSNNAIFENTITRNTIGIYLVESSNNMLSENMITENNEDGIRFEHALNNNISRNHMTENNFFGIYLGGHSSNNAISGNNINANNNEGIWLSWSSNNAISNNNITNNELAGIYLYGSSTNGISENEISGNMMGMWLGYSSGNTISNNEITANRECGLRLYGSLDNIVAENEIGNNNCGIYLHDSSNNNIIYHNNIVHNIQQVSSVASTNLWDTGYPSGGNYWSDHIKPDDYSGINQDEPDSDGIVDEPYIIDANNQDNYPLATPLGTVPVTIELFPETLNVYSLFGRWIKVYIELPEGYDLNDVDIATIKLNDEVPAELHPTQIGDYDQDGTPDLMVKFDRTDVVRSIFRSGEDTLIITGKLTEKPFMGRDTIRLVHK